MSRKTVVTTGAAGITLIVGAAAFIDRLITEASPEGLATTSRALVATGLVGLLVMVAVVAVRLRRMAPRRDGGGDRRPALVSVPVRTPKGLDSELIRFIDAERLGDREMSRP